MNQFKIALLTSSLFIFDACSNTSLARLTKGKGNDVDDEDPQDAEIDTSTAGSDVGTENPTDDEIPPSPASPDPGSPPTETNCGTSSDPLIETDTIVEVGEGRPVLLISWLPRSLVSANTQTELTRLVSWADASMCSLEPSAGSCQGLMSQANGVTALQDGYLDVVVITKSMLLWFDRSARGPLTPGTNLVPNGGGGLLRGVWLTKPDATGALWFEGTSATKRAINMLLPGAGFPSPGTTDGILQGGGLSLFWTTTDTDDGVTNNLENDPNALMTLHGPASFFETSAADRFLLQTRGHLVGMGRYLDGIEVLVTNRFSGCSRALSSEFFVRNTTAGDIGPLRAVSVATNHFGAPVEGFRFADLIDFDDTSPETCLAITRAFNTPPGQCESQPFSFFDRFVSGQTAPLGELGIAVQSKPNFDVPPPTFLLNIFKNKPSARMKLYPAAGFLASRFIYDTHSTGGIFVVPSWDGSAFSASDCESADERINLDCGSRLPTFITRTNSDYYFKAAESARMQLDISFTDP